MPLLTHFSWKHQETSVFLQFLGDVERKQSEIDKNIYLREKH